MSRIHVCPLSKVEATLAASGAASVVSLLASGHRVPDFPTIDPAKRLHLSLSDIVIATDAHILPEADHVERLLRFLRGWDRRAPLLLHCYAGVSRSTAAAYVALCSLAPGVAEIEHAGTLRAASPHATPNPRLVALADAALGRAGRMSAAIAGIGRGADCFEGAVFALDMPSPAETDARRNEMV